MITDILPKNLKGGITKHPRWADANSLEAFRHLADNCHREVFDEFLRMGLPLTDRQVKTLLGKDDMNDVRPRISELLGFGFLVKSGNIKDEKSGFMVRQCIVNWKKFGHKECQATLPGLQGQQQFTNWKR